MNHRRWMLGLAYGLGLANVAFASGGTVRQATSNNLDYITVLQLPNGTNDREITRFGREGVAFPNGSEFDPNSVICGARSRSGHQSNITVNRPELCDIRLEDPNNPGFPDAVTVPSPGNVFPVAADSNASPAQCPGGVSYQNYTFNAGAGVNDPLVAVFLTWQIPGAGANDPCYIGLELGSAPCNGRAKYFNSTTATYIPGCGGGGNIWLDAVVFTPFILDLNFRMSGSAQFPGDRGRPVWTIRAEEGNGLGSSTIIDDFITTTVIVDNGTGGPLTSQTLALVGDRSVINPKLTPKDLAASFRLLSNPKVSLASGNPYSWSPGRTILRANIPATISGKFEALFPINLPFVASSRNTTLPLGTGPRDDERQELGLRRQRGNADDGSSEIAQIVQGPAITGDVLGTRWPAQRAFPTRAAGNPAGAKVVSISVTALQVGAVSVGSATGFDALQLRKDDAVILNSADQSPQGLLAAAGTTGGAIGEGSRMTPPIPVDPNGAVAFFSFPVAAVVPSADGDFWINTYPFPGDIGGAGPNGTFLGTDTTPDTVLHESFTSQAGAQPYQPLTTGNFMSRVIFTASNPFAGEDQAPTVVPPVVTKHPGRVGEATRVPVHVTLQR
ncbi:MAG: hypothetical protein HYR85_27590 [Planctomycetes bacterium]|nr:hypothetical protein [Planctomycetota bacterium]